MKHLCRATFAALGLLAVAGLAWGAQQAKPPVNKMCPVMPDHKVDAQVTVLYKGKTIGVCCTDCVKKWNANPAAFAGAVKEDYGTPDMPDGANTVKGAVESGKAGGYLVAVVFVDKTPKSDAFMKVFLDAAVNPEILNCAFGKVEFKKDSEEAKQFKVTSAPTLLLLDPTKEPVAVLKTITAPNPKTLLKDLQESRDKLGK